MTKPNKLLIVRNEHKAREVQHEMGDEWLVKGYMSALTGRCFDLIVVVQQSDRSNVPLWEKYMGHLRTRLKPNGKLIELY